MAVAALVAVTVLVAFVVGMQIYVRAQARAMRGQALPPLPGPLGRRIARAPSALLYFMSPSCGACRAWTPKVERLREKNSNVYVIDAMQQLELARALRVMATPSVVEVQSGRVAGYHVGSVPSDVLARFG